MNEQWKTLYKNSGWDIDKICGVATHYHEPLNSLLSKMVSGSSVGPLPLVIPRIGSDGRLSFYLVGKDEQQTEEIFTVSKAYLGTSFTSYSPMTHRKSNDTFEKTVLELYPYGFKRIILHESYSLDTEQNDAHWVMDSLNRALEQYHDRPTSISIIKRPLGVILRHFFIAVQNNEGDNALQLLNELKKHQRLSPRNVLSLEIQALVSGRQWQQVLRHPKLDVLVRGTIPRRLQNVLLDSVGYASNNSTTPTSYSRELLSEELQNLYPLFSSPPDLENNETTAEKWKLWAIGAVALGRTIVTEQLPSCIESKWIEDLRGWAGISHIDTTPPHTPKNSIIDYLSAEMTSENAAKLIVHSIQANFKQNHDIYVRLCEYPNELIQVLSDESAKIRSLWTILKEEQGDSLEIDSWHQLFQILGNNCSHEDAESALTITIERSEYWLESSWQSNEVLSEIESIADDIAQSTLRGVLPILISWLEEKDKRIPSDAIEYLMVILVSDEQVAAEDLLLSNDLLLMLLNQLHTKEHYNTVLNCIDECWSKIKSPRAVDSILEVFETLMDYPSADENRRLQSWLTTQTNIITLWSRLESHQHKLCYVTSKFIVNDISALPELILLESEHETNEVFDLSGKLLAIYTLTEGAGRRAKDILSDYFPSLEIKLNHDKSATDSLINLADTADYFVFTSRSAAHQAFYPVSKRRKDLIYPKGKGASSIVREFLSQLS